MHVAFQDDGLSRSRILLTVLPTEQFGQPAFGRFIATVTHYGLYALKLRADLISAKMTRKIDKSRYFFTSDSILSMSLKVNGNSKLKVVSHLILSAVNGEH